MLEFLLAIFANYRLARLVATDDITYPVRLAVGRRASGKPANHPWYFLAELVCCPYCLGVWFGAFFALLSRPKSFRAFLLSWLAIAGGQAALQELLDKPGALEGRRALESRRP